MAILYFVWQPNINSLLLPLGTKLNLPVNICEAPHPCHHLFLLAILLAFICFQNPRTCYSFNLEYCALWFLLISPPASLRSLFQEVLSDLLKTPLSQIPVSISLSSLCF
jgi:hypothetical protein